MGERPSFFQSVRELGAAQERLDGVMEDAPVGVYVDHPSEGCVFANPALLDMFGQTWEEFRGFGWALTVVKEDTERFREAIERYEHDLEPINVTYRMRRPNDDELRWIHARVRPILAEDGRHIGSIGIVYDVTDERTMREQLSGSQKLEAVGRLAARVAHDFNNLLTVMTLAVESLRDPEEAAKPDSFAESLDALDQAVEQAGQVTAQLLTLTRQNVADTSLTVLDEEIRRLAPLLERTLGEGVQLELALEAGTSKVALGTAQIGQIVLNLATNGMDAMSGRGRLVVRTAREAETVRLSVEDFGEGMDAATMKRVFEPFFTTKEAGRGTGLGLATVRDTADTVGGSASIRSTPGEGTVVTIELPVVHAEMAASSAARDATARERGDASVLIVEDKDALRQSLAYALALHGYRVRSARSLEEARKLLDPPPDVLVTDVMLPDGAGTELIGELRARTPGLPVVITSGFAGDAIDDLELDPSHTVFLAKPFRQGQLFLHIANLLGSSAPATG